VRYDLGMKIRHGHTEGDSTPTYRSWEGMKRRCLSPKATNYHLYGAKGVTVCERWLTFDNFLADMGVRPSGLTLDRIDGSKGYEPGNCRWATRLSQNQNRTFSPEARRAMSDAGRRTQARRRAARAPVEVVAVP
jgi:hypothetical protein